jgi:tetratricopeptide (TPR) repeat protein
LGDVTILENESRRAMELFPEQAEPYLYNGFANTKLKNYQPALKALRTGLAFTYESEMIEKFQSNLGDLLYDMKRYDEAFEAYERALKENPNNTYVLEKYTTGLIEQKQNYIRAIEMSRTLYDLDSDNLKYKDLYATALFLSGEQEQAKIYWDQILKGDTQPPATVYEHYGDLMFKMNNVEAAVEYWKRAKDAGLVSEKLDRKINDRKLYE